MDFARFVLDHLANRTDAHGVYRRGSASTSKDALTAELLDAHFRGEAIVGLHVRGKDGTSRFGVWDFDNHGHDGPTAERNATESRALWDRLREMGAEPLLEDSDGQGGWHVWVILDAPVPTADLAEWTRTLAPAGVEHFPRHGDDAPYGHWVRLPGRHPKRDHRSTIHLPDGPVDCEDWPWGDFPLCPASLVPAAAERDSGTAEGLENVGAYDDGIGAGDRNNRLASMAGSMRARGMGEAAIFAGLQVENSARCVPPLTEHEVRAIARSISRYAPAEQGEAVVLPVSEDREEILAALNRELSRDNRPVTVLRILRRDETYTIEAETRRKSVPAVDWLLRFDRFQAVVADLTGVRLNDRLRKRWAILGQLLLDIIEESDAETKAEETRAWLAAVERARKYVDLDDPEEADKFDVQRGGVLCRRGPDRYVLIYPLVRWLYQSGTARIDAREMSRRLGELGFVRTRVGVRGARPTMWRSPNGVAKWQDG